MNSGLGNGSAVKSDHSSLEADTGLSEIELDRLGVVPVRREVDPHAGFRSRKGWQDLDDQTWARFEDSKWWEDPDVVRYHELRKYYQ